MSKPYVIGRAGPAGRRMPKMTHEVHYHSWYLLPKGRVRKTAMLFRDQNPSLKLVERKLRHQLDIDPRKKVEVTYLGPLLVPMNMV